MNQPLSIVETPTEIVDPLSIDMDIGFELMCIAERDNSDSLAHAKVMLYTKNGLPIRGNEILPTLVQQAHAARKILLGKKANASQDPEIRETKTQHGAIWNISYKLLDDVVVKTYESDSGEIAMVHITPDGKIPWHYISAAALATAEEDTEEMGAQALERLLDQSAPLIQEIQHSVGMMTDAVRRMTNVLENT